MTKIKTKMKSKKESSKKSVSSKNKPVEQVKKNKVSTKKNTTVKKTVKEIKSGASDDIKTPSKALKEIKDLAKILSGEMDLMEKQEILEKKKVAAKKRNKEALVEKIANGSVKLEKDDETIDVETVVQNVKLFEWDAPIRIKYVFEMKAFMYIVAASLLFIVYLAVLGHYMLMLSIVSILFLLYVAGTTEPLIIKNIITARGIDTLDKLYEWFVLERFWFSVKNGQHMLIIETKLKFPGRLILMLDVKDRQAIFMLLQEKLLYREIKKMKKMEAMSFGEYVKLEEI